MTAYVLLSGGVDSSTCLAMAKEEYGSAVGISLLYGQRHAKELASASDIAKHFDCKHVIHDIRGAIGIGGLTDDSLEIPKMSYEEMGEGVSPTYVPFRNGTLLAIATSLAAADPEAVAVYYGAHAEDAENDAYPDCSEEFAKAMDNAIRIGTYERIKLVRPLIKMTKAQVVQQGELLGVPWTSTWSCYEGGELHCGTCPTCLARKEAFKLANVEDPTEYTPPPPLEDEDEVEVAE